MNTTHRKPGRPRKDESAVADHGPRRRKKREGVIGRRLGVNEHILDFENFKYRWLNDKPGRLVAMTKSDDWDFVTNDGGTVKSDSADLGDVVSQVVGTGPDGNALRAYLCRKPRKFWEEDQAQKQAELDEQLEQIRRGNSKSGESQSDYIPSGGIRIA
jgi:hypothetical protein